jgi:hypothetical protein
VQYVTGTVPDVTMDERLGRGTDEVEPEREPNPGAAPLEEPLLPETGAPLQAEEITGSDVDDQGRLSEPERDWQGQPQADAGRDRPGEGARRKR